MVMAAQRLGAKTRSAQHPAGLLGQSSQRDARRDALSARDLMGDAAHRAPGDAGDGAKQVPGLWVSVKRSCHFPDPTGQLGRGSGQRFGNLGKSPLCHRSDRLGDHRKKLAGGHSNQRKEVLGGLVFALGFRRQFAQMFHHGVWIDFADGADLIFIFVLGFAFVFIFTLAEQAAGNIADGAEPAFAFQTSFILHLIFQFVFSLVLEFCFELVFEFRQGFQFAFICHDEILLQSVIDLGSVLYQAGYE
jgi:hypothetical protein